MKLIIIMKPYYHHIIMVIIIIVLDVALWSVMTKMTMGKRRFSVEHMVGFLLNCSTTRGFPLKNRSQIG